jgi:3-phenylpropionate/trans-cinnamate dioxygenase ferredoxin subunit
MTAQPQSDYGDPVHVCHEGDLPAVGAAQAQIEGRLVAIVRTEDGEIHAIDDTCTHANVSLAEGELTGCMLECWLHGSVFDVRTGDPANLPATVPVAVHQVTVDDAGEVYVALAPGR